MYSIGFTGSRNGMTKPQRRILTEWFQEFNHFELEFRHGDCVGSDLFAHCIVVNIPTVRVIIHPGPNTPLRAHCKGAFSVLPDCGYELRNQQIVKFSDRLFATPDTQGEIDRSGTWQTIRMARKKGIPITILFPDGTFKDEFPWD